MKRIIILNKKEGETSLQALETFRKKHPAYKSVKMTYAGRLDPMASGLLLILADEEVKNKEKYLKLGKTYEFEILFGFATDTYDILGKINSKILTNIRISNSLIKSNLIYFRGQFLQKYPAYSSKTWVIARRGESIEAEARQVTVYQLYLTKLKLISSKKLLSNIERRIKKVSGDFRQKEILNLWRKKLKKKESYYIGNFKVSSSSGLYVRSIAHELGKRMGVPALAYSIKRTKIGKWINSGVE